MLLQKTKQKNRSIVPFLLHVLFAAAFDEPPFFLFFWVGLSVVGENAKEEE